MIKILLSIHKRHADSILDGTKTFEFRRVIPARQASMVLMYATMPTGRIVGDFGVARVLSMAPDDLWAATKSAPGITRAEFDRYFSGRAVAHAFEVSCTMRYDKPIDPRGLDPEFRAPQSFCYWPQVTCKGYDKS